MGEAWKDDWVGRGGSQGLFEHVHLDSCPFTQQHSRIFPGCASLSDSLLLWGKLPAPAAV